MKLFLIILIFLFTSSLLAEEIPKIQCTLDEVQDVINGKYYKSNDTFLFEPDIIQMTVGVGVFSLGVAGIVLGKASDLIGRKPILLLGVAFAVVIYIIFFN